jgi:hypothetical protein
LLAVLALFLADIIATIHLGYVIFVILGFVLIVVGVIFKWRWKRNLWFRILHLAAIVAVASEALLGVNCPLTICEFRLRYPGMSSQDKLSFIGTLIDSILFYDAPGWLFTIIYTTFAIIVAITFVLAPPSRKDHTIRGNRCSGMRNQ